MKPDARRTLPSVDRLLRQPAIAALGHDHPAPAAAPLLTRAVRQAIATARQDVAAMPHSDAEWTARVAAELDRLTLPTLRRVVNATGVVLHTNLGRAPLAPAAAEAVREAGQGYSTLEYDVPAGARGSRHVHCAGLLRELTGAPDAMVVNNAASALVLAIATLAHGGDVIVSRGELIEIGGGFRIPEIMETGGATLREVGTTNRTRLADYENALKAGHGGTGAREHRKVARRAVALLKVHRSNFRLEGFTAEASIAELVALGRKKRAPVIYDLGSGLMLDLAGYGLPGEPTLPLAARSGATAVIASGDKLLGGPQAGLLLGTTAFIKRARAHPLARAIRADKLTLGGLAATLALYREPDRARREIPVLRMLTEGPATLRQAAEALAAGLPARAAAAVVPTRAAVGGGSYPGVELDSFGVALAPHGMTATALATALRMRAVPIVATVARGRVLLDARTLLPGDGELIRAALERILA